jgi:predicted phosphodiesterase
MTGPILFCGDPHGQFRHIVRAAGELDASAVVLLGDMEPLRPMHEELEAIAERVWFIHGNHDTDTDRHWAHVWESRLADRNIDGRVVELPGGTRLAGLGGVFRESVWYPNLPAAPFFRNRAEHVRSTSRQERWRGGTHRRHWSSIYPDDLDRLADLRAEILVTHEAPGYHRSGFGILDSLAQSLGVKVAVHGHQHDRLDSSERWAQQGFKSFGVGLRGITAIDADGNARVIVPGELDERRNFRQRYIDIWTGLP